jgi:hypothetical protein
MQRSNKHSVNHSVNQSNNFTSDWNKKKRYYRSFSFTRKVEEREASLALNYAYTKDFFEEHHITSHQFNVESQHEVPGLLIPMNAWECMTRRIKCTYYTFYKSTIPQSIRTKEEDMNPQMCDSNHRSEKKCECTPSTRRGCSIYTHAGETRVKTAYRTPLTTSDQQIGAKVIQFRQLLVKFNT